MTHDPNDSKAQREYAQLLRLHQKVLGRLEAARDELGTPSNQDLLREIRSRTGSTHGLADVVHHTEEAIRALKLAESTLQKTVFDTPSGSQVEGAPNLPAHLQRFLAERAALPGFSYEVLQDPVRGWIICWKEYTEDGTVRGYGQINERPFAWIDQ